MPQTLDHLLAPNATPRLLADGFGFTEGVAADADGNVYFVDIGNNRVHHWDVATETLTTVREDSGGADGMFVDEDGALWICEMGACRISKISREGEYTVVVDAFEGEPFTGPNDLWFDDQGGLYFTDSYQGHGDRGNETRVFYLPRDGELLLLADDYYKSNGLHGSPDGRWLYIADYLDDKIYRYNVPLPGKLADRTLFCEVRCDGMTVDAQGDLYLCTGNGGQGVVVVNPDGETIGAIETPENAHNIGFGGPDYDTLYIAATHGLYALDMHVTGALNGSPLRGLRDFGGLVDLVAPGAKLQFLSGGYRVAQGPTPLADGSFVFADIYHNRILRYDLETNTQTLLTDETIGGDGLAPMLDGTILVCELPGKRLCRIETDGSYTVLAEEFEGEPLTGVNDIFVDSQGGVYFSDSYPSLDPDGKAEFCNYYIPPGGIEPGNCQMVRIIEGLYKGKGMFADPEEKWLYVVDFAGRVVYRYELLAPGKLGERTRFVERMVGGMTLDEHGNLYLSTVMDGAGVVIYSPEGELIGQILVPKCTSNVAFAGPEGKTLIITTFENIYTIEMQVTGYTQTHGYPVAHRR